MEKAGITTANTQRIDIEEHLAPPQERKLTLDSLSGLSNSNKWEDKYPSAIAARSPKFDQSQLLGAIELKEQFLSSKRDKMSELVRKMFEKQLVSPRSYEFQLKSLDRRYQQENQQLESMRKQAEQLSSMLSEIRKDKEEIQGIDELIRNEKWE
jgi:phage shock protein A